MKSKKTTAVLFAAFGFVGAHRAYLRQYWAIPIYVLLSVLSLAVVNFPLLIALVLDGAYFIAMSDEDFNAKYNSGQKSKMLEKFEKLHIVWQILIVILALQVALIFLALFAFLLEGLLTARSFGR